MEFTQISWINMKNTMSQNYRKCLLSSTMQTSDMPPVELQLFFSKEFARIHNLPTQDFMVRNDMGCGSTIASILASGMGVRTVDCGTGQAFHAQVKLFKTRSSRNSGKPASWYNKACFLSQSRNQYVICHCGANWIGHLVILNLPRQRTSSVYVDIVYNLVRICFDNSS
ncbi:hypothetical protein Vadar_024749 [Vaccinium darrowii]|nr:hypothetical protein Vadar_024749 [Vaccinium darrowii]